MSEEIKAVHIKEPTRSKPYYMIYVTTEKRGVGIKVQVGEGMENLGSRMSDLSDKILK
jgi:hypothetical protein